MIGLSDKLMLAIAVVSDIAGYEGVSTVRSSEICMRQGIPPRHLELVLQELTRTGILVGVRGPRGGYRLGRDRSEISLARIAEAVEKISSVAASRGDYPSPVG